MQKTAIIPINESSAGIASILKQEFHAETLSRTEVGDHWNHFDAFIFIGAMGICVRTIAPYINDKHHDPAVVCVDSTGRYAVSVLSGHVGGGNELARTVAAAIGAESVVTTQSDNTGLWPLDTIGGKWGWNTLFEGDSNLLISKFVNKEPTALLLDIRDKGTEYLERTLPNHVTVIDTCAQLESGRFSAAIIVSPFLYELPKHLSAVRYIPQVLDLGIGLAHQAPLSSYEDIKNHLAQHHITIASQAIRNICTIDIKAEEPIVKEMLKEAPGSRLVLFSSEELNGVEVPTPSTTVAKHVGTSSVCEAAALLASDHGKLVLSKEKGKDYTLAVAIERNYLREGHIEIVGAGPGDPDLVSVRGRRMLEKADLILYAGSLVPRATVRSSASMALEEQCTLMKDFYDRGKFIVRLHTGDPCIFGAIQEQMAFFDQHGMSYHITPGISSFLAAAAELRSQFTIPERCQTIILTRGEGRTPMPEREKLHLLARSQSTMCIFLSASIVDDVQRQLLMEYPADTPVAACYHLTWPDQRIYRGKLSELSKIVHDNHLTLTTMIVVGEAIDNRAGLSALYSKHFTHLFRKSIDEKP